MQYRYCGRPALHGALLSRCRVSNPWPSSGANRTPDSRLGHTKMGDDFGYGTTPLIQEQVKDIVVAHGLPVSVRFGYGLLAAHDLGPPPPDPPMPTPLPVMRRYVTLEHPPARPCPLPPIRKTAEAVGIDGSRAGEPRRPGQGPLWQMALWMSIRGTIGPRTSGQGTLYLAEVVLQRFRRWVRTGTPYNPSRTHNVNRVAAAAGLLENSWRRLTTPRTATKLDFAVPRLPDPGGHDKGKGPVNQNETPNEQKQFLHRRDGDHSVDGSPVRANRLSRRTSFWGPRLSGVATTRSSRRCCEKAASSRPSRSPQNSRFKTRRASPASGWILRRRCRPRTGGALSSMTVSGIADSCLIRNRHGWHTWLCGASSTSWILPRPRTSNSS